MIARGGTEARIIDQMKALGFTTTDAKTYIALLKGHPAGGYELAGRSGVPRSAIYKVLRNLESAGLVNAVQDKPARYVPLPPDRLIDLLETRFTRSLEELRAGLDGIGEPTEEAATWTVHGYEAMLEQAEALIAGSDECVFGSLWRREADRLQPHLRDLTDADKDVILFSFNELEDHLGTVLCYGMDPADLERYWSHKIILISDRRRLLVGDAEDNADTRAVLTDHVPLVEMALSNLVLDITLYGQRMDVDVTGPVARLTRHLVSPAIDDLVAQARARRR